MTKNVQAAVHDQKSKIAAIDFHDARLDSVTICGGGICIMSFNHIDVFIEESREHYGVWSYSADLFLQGVDQISLDKPLGSTDYVSDGSILDADGREIELASVLERTDADRVELILSSSAKLSVKVSHVQLSLLESHNRLEEWIGPLTEN